MFSNRLDWRNFLLRKFLNLLPFYFDRNQGFYPITSWRKFLWVTFWSSDSDAYRTLLWLTPIRSQVRDSDWSERIDSIDRQPTKILPIANTHSPSDSFFTIPKHPQIGNVIQCVNNTCHTVYFKTTRWNTFGWLSIVLTLCYIAHGGWYGRALSITWVQYAQYCTIWVFMVAEPIIFLTNPSCWANALKPHVLYCTCKSKRFQHALHRSQKNLK